MLAPVWALLGLAALPGTAGRLGLSPLLALVVGAALTALAVLRSSGRRRWTLAFGVGGTLWAWLAVAFGPVPAVLAGLVVVWLPPAALWWRGARVRSRIVVHERQVPLLPRGEWWFGRDVGRTLAGLRAGWLPQAREWWAEQRYRRTARRELTRICNDWRRTAAAAEVPGCRIRRAEADHVAYTLHIDLRRGQPRERMLRHHSMLCSALGAVEEGTLRIDLEKRMDRVRIRWVHRDPLAGEAICWPHLQKPEATSAEQPFTLGPNEIGEPVRVRLADGVHTLVVGVTDAGKSSLLHVVIASAAAMRDVVLWGVDMGRVEFELWDGVWERLAVDADGAERLLAALDRVVQARLEVLADAGSRKWSPSLGPYVLVVIDELAQLPPGLRRQLGKLVQLCRKCGVRLVVATNHPTVEETNSALRSQLDRIVCLRLKSEGAVRMTFDMPQPQAAGWDPSRLEVSGSFLIKSPKHLKPVMARAYFLDDQDVTAAARRLAPGRPPLDLPSATAAALVEAHQALGPPDVATVEEPVAGETPPGEEGLADPLMSTRLPLLLAALRRAGRPVSGRSAARLANLPHGWVGSRGLPELERRGEVRRTEVDEWALAEPGPEVAGE